MKKIANKTILKNFLIISIIMFSFFIFTNVKAQTENGYSDQSDAIAVKVIPNPNHYSISTWYKRQNFLGSPQSLIVDGYEGIRDGRTVYVNAANVSGDIIYTNIYVISYSQEPSEKTVDILGQIVSRWEFNNSLNEEFQEEPYTCSISSYNCDIDSDCQSGQYCSESEDSIGTCLLEDTKNCLIDSDCPNGYFCNSPKAMVIRDTKRIGSLEEMKNSLNNYYKNNGFYPKLNSGTYLINKSVSVWPSWKNSFLPEIAMSPTYIDIINSIGNCPGYDKETCWNIEEKKFYSDAQYESLELPNNSYVMVYTSNPEGSRYNLCSSLETPSISKNFIPGDYSGSACLTNFTLSGGTGENIAPELVDFYLEAQSGQELNGYIRLKDVNNDNLEWRLDTSASNWTNWSDPPRLIDTSSSFEKKVYAEKTNLNTGEPFKITAYVSDGHGGEYQEEFEIQIKDLGVFIEAENSSHTLKIGTPFKYSFYFSGENLPSNPALIQYGITKLSGPVPISGNNYNIFTLDDLEAAGTNRFKATLSGEIDPNLFFDGDFAEDVRLNYSIGVYDKNGRLFNKIFYIDLISPKPPLDFSCPLSLRLTSSNTVGDNKFLCNLGSKTYLGEEIYYSFSSNLTNYGEFTLNDNGFDSNAVYLEGYANDTDADLITVKVTARTRYGATSEKSFNLKINTYCGDGYLGDPNTEGKGGAYNDGYEQCERGGLGTASDVESSSIDKQYGCTIGPETLVPLEISNNSYCTFSGYLSGGGFCGDYFCQTGIEDDTNCAVDCSDDLEEEHSYSCSGNPDCEAGYRCNTLLGRCVVDENYCEDTNDCEGGFECNPSNNLCEEKCWTLNEVVSTVKFYQGDANRAGVYYYRDNKKKSKTYTSTNINDIYYNIYNRTNNCTWEGSKYNCTTIHIDNAYCNNTALCPLGFGYTYYLIGGGGSGDSCYEPTGNLNSNWHDRNIYECRKNENIERCYGDVCRLNDINSSNMMSTVNDGRVNINGVCE